MKRRHALIIADYSPGSYDACLTCKFLGKGCDGPNTQSMTLERWCEWCYDLKTVRGYTNEEVSELSTVSLGTVNNIFSRRAPKDIMRSTASLITSALVGSCGQWPCSLAFEQSKPVTQKELDAKNAEIESLREALKKIHDSYAEEIASIRKDAQIKIDYLKHEGEKKDKIIEQLLNR